MTTDDANHRDFPFLRTLLVLVGGAIMASSLFADRLGFGQPGGFGIGQLLLGLAGLFMLLVGLLGTKIVHPYRGLAIILLNTLVLVGCLELGAIVVSRFYQRAELAGVKQLPYYANQDWTETYWRETSAAEDYRYKPYVVWGHLPFTGETVNVNQEGVRQIPGVDCNTEAFKVFTFGGSTMWGWGSPDWGTIPAYLATGLDALMTTPVCVVNLAEDGYVSTQSLVALMLQLQSGNAPDAVIFYDGINEVQAAYESGQANAHVTLAKIAARYEEREHPLIKWFKASRQYTLLEKWVDESVRKREEANPDVYRDKVIERDRLADSVAEVYSGNYKIVGALAQEYGFDYFFFLQPHLASGEKQLTKDEQTMRSRIDPGWASLASAVYEKTASAMPHHENYWDLTDVFDGVDTQIWIDEVGHITPEGNRLVAEKIVTLIEQQLTEK